MNSTPTKSNLIPRTLYVCIALVLSQSLHANVLLTGLLQSGTYASGQTVGSPIFNTLGNEASFANLYVTQPNGGYLAPFINHGNGADASISYSLTPGSYHFFFFSDTFAANNPGHYGLNLFFEGDNTNPGIAGFSPSGSTNVRLVPGGLNTLSLNGDNGNQVPAPGTLSYTANGLSIRLTAYGYGESGAFAVPAIDRAGNLNDVPNGYSDAVGVFDLKVSSVPEPPSQLNLLIGTIALFVIGFLRNRQARPDRDISNYRIGGPKTKSFGKSAFLVVLTTLIIALVFQPENGSCQPKRDDQIVDEFQEKFMAHGRDFLAFAKAFPAGGHEQDRAFDLCNMITEIYERSDFISEELFILSVVETELAKKRVGYLIKQRIQRMIELDKANLGKINIALAATKSPAIVAQCNKLKEDLKDFQGKLLEVADKFIDIKPNAKTKDP